MNIKFAFRFYFLHIKRKTGVLRARTYIIDNLKNNKCGREFNIKKT